MQRRKVIKLPNGTLYRVGGSVNNTKLDKNNVCVNDTHRSLGRVEVTRHGNDLKTLVTQLFKLWEN